MTNSDSSIGGGYVGHDAYTGDVSVQNISGSYTAVGHNARVIVNTQSNHIPDLLSWIDQCVENNIADSDRRALVECLLACSECPSTNLHTYPSLESLMRFVLRYEQHEEAKNQLLATFERIYGYELPFVHLATLIDLVSHVGLEAGTLRDLYRRSAPDSPRWRLPDMQHTDTLRDHILYRLAQASRQHDGTYPLMTFVARLVGLLDHYNPLRTALEHWLRETETMLGVEPTRGLADGASDHAEQDDTSPLYLLVRLAPRVTSTGVDYYVTAWFGPDQQQIYPTTVDDEEAQPLEQIDQVVQKLLSQVVKGLTGEVVIELFVPVELFDYASDHWQMKQGKRSSFLLGEKYQLVTRSYDRLYDPEMHSTHYDWRARWKLWKASLAGQAKASVQWFHTERECAIDALIGNPTIPFLILTFVPSVHFREALFWSLLDAGIPVALLPRKQVLPPAHMEQRFQELCHDSSILSKRLKTLRWEAVQAMKHRHAHIDDPDCFGCHVTLLWDDPERLPPDGMLY